MEKHRNKVKKKYFSSFKLKKYITFTAPLKKKRGVFSKNKKKPLSITKQKKLHKLANVNKKKKNKH
jgi:hypothetical protein